MNKKYGACHKCGSQIERSGDGWVHTGLDTNGFIPPEEHHIAAPMKESQVERSFGYAFEHEDQKAIQEFGVPTEHVLANARSANPNFNPYADAYLWLQYQGMQGACQGHALAHAFQDAMIKKHGIQALFSRAAAYYLSQKADGINGDKGSTLRGGQKVAESGLCLESEWKYPQRYNPRQPESANGNLNITMPGSKLVTDADHAWELLGRGLCIQTGVAWTNSFEKEISDSYRSSGNVGGHSTLLYGLMEGTDNAIHHNSWRGWMQDSRSQWTKNFFRQILKEDDWAVFVAYDWTKLSVPDDIKQRLKIPDTNFGLAI